MKGVVDKIPNDLAHILANVVITKGDVKKTLLDAASLISSTTEAKIITNEDTQGGAIRQFVSTWRASGSRLAWQWRSWTGQAPILPTQTSATPTEAGLKKWTNTNYTNLSTL